MPHTAEKTRMSARSASRPRHSGPMKLSWRLASMAAICGESSGLESKEI